MINKSNGFTAVIDTPPGRLAIRTTSGELTGIDYVETDVSLMKASDPLAKEVVRQLQLYFSDPAYRFDLPVSLEGTPHQLQVWQQLRGIKPGTTMTYGELAQQIDSGARAVGNSCRRNPVPIVIPCHRVVAASGIGGYGGQVNGPVLDRKQWLLRHEAVSSKKP